MLVARSSLAGRGDRLVDHIPKKAMLAAASFEVDTVQDPSELGTTILSGETIFRRCGCFRVHHKTLT